MKHKRFWICVWVADVIAVIITAIFLLRMGAL